MHEPRTPLSPPFVSPLPANIERPFWSVMVPAFNCSSFLEETLLSLMRSEHFESMQIEVVDDASTDSDVENLVRQIGKGKIGYYRQQQNVGSLRNFETCINRARGHWVHILHGDDKIHPAFYTEIKMLIDANPSIGAAFCRNAYINEEGKELFLADEIQTTSGIIDNWLLKIAQRQQVEPPSIVVKRSVYEKLGSFYGIHYGEDWVMWVRIAAQFQVAYTPKVLAYYRDRSNNISANSILSGNNISDTRKAIAIVRTYLPAKDQKKITAHAKKSYAIFFAGKAYTYFKISRFKKNALRQAFLAFQLHANKTTLKCILLLSLRYIKFKLSLK